VSDPADSSVIMKFHADRDELADAVSWASRALPARPSMPVLAGMVLDATEDTLRVSCFDHEVSAQATMALTEAEPGRALVSGRLAAEIVRSLPAGRVEVSCDGADVRVVADGTAFALPTMPLEDHPRLPTPPPHACAVDGAAFASAVARVAPAAGRDDTPPMLTGVRLELGPDALTLACTDRYRIAVTEIPCRGGSAATALVPARSLLDAAKHLSSRPDVTIMLGGGTAGLDGGGRRTTIRLLEDRFIDFRPHFAAEATSTAELATASLVEAIKRVSLVAERHTPVRLAFEGGELRLESGSGGAARAVATLPCRFEGEAVRTAFNPGFLLDAMSGVGSGTARLAFTESAKRAIVTDGHYRCVLMPVRLAS
jgi:DNA polymerase-3 subunit beta